MDDNAAHNPDSETADGTQPDRIGDGTDPAFAADVDPAFALVEIEYRGQKWLIPKDRGQWDMNVQFEFEDGNRMRGFFILLGGSPSVDDVQRIRAQVYKVCRTNVEVDDFMNHVTAILNKECTG